MITLTRGEAQNVLNLLILWLDEQEEPDTETAIETLRAKLRESELKDAPVWYFMRDNHTFRKLTGSVESMLAAINEEISAGYTSGSVFCRALKIDIYCNYKNTAAFTEECRAVIAKATGE